MSNFEICKYTIVKNDRSYTVYNEKTKANIDIFQNDDDGKEKLIEFICKNILNFEGSTSALH